MIQATQLRRGNTILHNGELFQVVDYQHITPGNWRGMVQTKLRNMRTGSIIDHRFRSEDRLEKAVLDQREMDADLSVVVALGPVIDAVEAVHVPRRVLDEGYVPGRGRLLDEALPADPAVGPLVVVRLHELLELPGAVFGPEPFGLPLAVLAPLHLVRAVAVLFGTFHDACHAGKIRAKSLDRFP